ncbi:MAG: hypothetical protein V5A16_00265 [Haloplanus sp.]
MPPRDRRRRPRATLKRLVSHPPPRLRDCVLDADGAGSRTSRADGGTPAVSGPPPASVTTGVACWTPIESPDPTSGPRELRATLLAEPSLPGTTDGPVTHTLVVEVDEPTASVELDYRPLDATVMPERGIRVRTDDDRSVPVSEFRMADDGTFVVTFADSPADGALFLEYQVTRNPDGGRHTVGVVVGGSRRIEARLVVVG